MKFLRNFYILLFLAIAVAIFAAGHFGRNYVEERIIKEIVRGHNKLLAEDFTWYIWYNYKDTISRLPCNGNSCPDPNRVAELKREIKSLHQDKNLLSARIYFKDGKTIFGSDPEFGKSFQDKPFKSAFTNAFAGDSSDKLIIHYNTGEVKKNVIRSFIPIIPDSGKQSRIPIILEVIYDITPFWNNVEQIQMGAITAVTVIFLLIFIISYIIMYRSEKLLSKQYETTADLEKSKNIAEQENEQKSQFLANVSHELRTPLNAIIGFSEIVKDEVMGPLENQQYKDYIRDIHASGVHLLSLINDILDYSKAEAGKLTVEMEDVDVTKVMNQSIRLVTPRAQEAGVHIDNQVPDKHYILHTDGKRLKQVMLNLLSNSVKFTPQGGTITLYGWHNMSDNTFVIEVRDTGVGIAAKDISKVMATFGQVENKLSRKYEGTGLGLPLSKRLVELMGGVLDIKSAEGKGTTVSIILPYTAKQSKKSAQANKSSNF